MHGRYALSTRKAAGGRIVVSLDFASASKLQIADHSPHSAVRKKEEEETIIGLSSRFFLSESLLLR